MWQKTMRLITVGLLSCALGIGWIVTPVDGSLTFPSTLSGDPGSGSGGG